MGKRLAYLFACFYFIGTTHLAVAKDADPKEIITRVVNTAGGLDKLKSLKDVEYIYTYRDAEGKSDVSIERYVFENEHSWAKYTKRERLNVPKHEGEVVQGHDGSSTWVTLNGQLVSDESAINRAHFLRKTNYYWFTMMFKLLDPGLVYSYEGKKSLDGNDYDLVKVTFDAGVGEVADIYLLYVNSKTNLVDQFLFTVMAFDKKDPLLMKVEYEEINGLKLPTKRKYAPASWDGTVKENKWVDEISTNVKFNNGFDKALFKKPAS